MTHPSEREIIRALSASRTFAGLHAEDFVPFLEAAQSQLFGEGEALVSEGDVLSAGYILVSGCVEQTAEHVPGRKLSRQHFASGTIIAGSGLIKDWPQDQSCVSVQQTVALKINRSAFKALLNAGNNVAFRILDELLDVFVAKVNTANQLIDSLYSHPDETLLLLQGSLKNHSEQV